MKKTTRVDLGKLTIQQLTNLICSDEDLVFEISENMLIYGGSFAKAMAQSLRAADHQNRRTLIREFHNLYCRYLSMNINS